MTDFQGKEITYTGCPSCAFARHEFDIPIVFENERFIINQDWETPINGFFIIMPKRHVKLLSDLTEQERAEMIELANKTMNAVRAVVGIKEFDFLFEESAPHFHIWLLPRHDWIKEIQGRHRDILKHAIENLRTPENIKAILKTCEKVKSLLN